MASTQAASRPKLRWHITANPAAGDRLTPNRQWITNRRSPGHRAAKSKRLRTAASPGVSKPLLGLVDIVETEFQMFRASQGGKIFVPEHGNHVDGARSATTPARSSKPQITNSAMTLV